MTPPHRMLHNASSKGCMTVVTIILKNTQGRRYTCSNPSGAAEYHSDTSLRILGDLSTVALQSVP